MIHLSTEKYKGFSHDYSEDFAAFLGNFTICKIVSCSLCGSGSTAESCLSEERRRENRKKCLQNDENLVS